MRQFILHIIVFFTASTVLSAAVGWWAYGTALDRLAERAETELSLASDRLVGQLQRFRQLSVVMADHPGLIALLTEDSDQFGQNANRLLEKTADKTGSYEIFVVSSTGHKIASSRLPLTNVEHGNSAYFKRAMHGALGSAQTQYGEETGRAFYFASPIKRSGEPPIGALVVKVNIEAVETDWRADPNILFFSDDQHVVFVSNRDALLFNTRVEISSAIQANENKRKYDPTSLKDFPEFWISRFSGHQLWHAKSRQIFPSTALHLEKSLPIIALNAEILVDAAASRLTAALQAIVAMAFSLIVGAGFFIMAQRRVALSRLLATEAQANRKLEDQVLRRTEQLSGVNQRLRQQINERIDAEEALNRAQQDLVQAGKLSALGQMSAGISHELNQPLMAIRSFAENAEVFLERGQLDTTKANLGRISDLARRMGRIIKNLRAFARKEGEPMTEVDLCAVIDASLELNDNRMQQAGVEVTWSTPLNAVWVRGGEVRLQQVLINLLGNAVDAMEDIDGTAEKRIEISIAQTGGTVILSVRDTGPGLSEPEKIFDPFYTTKKVVQSEGMGLGLSISYGIVQSFGGKIAGRNHPDGGSVFTVELALVANEAAA